MDEHGSRLLGEVELLRNLLSTYRMLTDQHLNEYCLMYLEDKLSKKPLRAYFSLLVYRYLKHYPVWQTKFATFDEKLFIVKLPFVFEVVISIQYLHNHILDEKNDTKINNVPRIDQNLVSSNILKEILYLYIDQEIIPYLAVDLGMQLHRRIHELFLCVDIGQYLDKNYNNYSAWKKENAEFSFVNSAFYDEAAAEGIADILAEVQAEIAAKSNFVEAYFRRIYCSNVYFFRCMMEIVEQIGGKAENEYVGNLKLFSIQYGFMLQIINDYADFAYSDNANERNMLKTAGKKSTDFFADLYNFNITLPLIFHLQEGYKRKIEAYLEGGKKRNKLLSLYPTQIKQEIVSSGAIHACINISRRLSQSARNQLDVDNPITPLFTDMCEMAFDNKFYRVFL